MKQIKKYYILILFILTLSSVILYKTYAMFTSTVVTDDIVNMDTIMNYTFDINGTQKITVGASTKARFNAVVKNNMNGKIYYGLYYKIINPSSLPNDIIIAQVSDDLTFISKGMVEASSSVTVPLVIKNNSDTDITVEIGVRTGYVTVNQGVDDIIYNEGEIPITSFLTNEEAGDDKYISTMECTTECIEKEENNKTEITTRTSEEMLTYMRLTSKTGTPSSGVATTDEGIYSAEDDYGTSYYFRGAATNNYVKFANYYWRIIRINGDGSIRMIYDGTVAHSNGEKSADRGLSFNKFNINTKDNAYVGYMYGSVGASTYKLTHTNVNNSTIKDVIDNWYKTNIENGGYKDKIADVIYCNDRKLYTNGVGFGATETYYKAYDRLQQNKSPILTCIQQNDAFTVNDEVKGNGALTYPVGLITADEVMMAGGNRYSSNSDYYLYTGVSYWTMSPSGYSQFGSAVVFMIDSTGSMDNSLDYGGVDNNYYVRPVLSLKNDIQLSGSGNINDPFIVQ